MRFFNKSPLEVARRFFDIRDRLATDVDDNVQLGFELRAVRPWEEFPGAIIRWSLTLARAADAANFGGLQITVNGSPPNFTAADPVPPGTLLSIDEILNLGANAVRLMIGAAATGLISAVPADYVDARWGPRQAIPPIRAVQGVAGARTGDDIGAVLSLQRYQYEGLFIAESLKAAEPLASDHTLTIWTNAINQAMDLYVRGRIILPR